MWAEIAALVGSVLVAAFIYAVPSLRALEFGVRETAMAAIVTALWLTVMWLTPPESDETLDAFYTRARPGGAWGPVRARTGLAPRQHLASDVRRVIAGVAALLGVNVGIGAALLQQWGLVAGAGIAAACGAIFLLRARALSADGA